MSRTVYPKKYAHGFVVLCFVVVMQSFIMNSQEIFIHIHQGCFAGTGAIVRLPQCQWSKPDGYMKISQCITTTKHSKAKTVCIFLGIYCNTQHIGVAHAWYWAEPLFTEKTPPFWNRYPHYKPIMVISTPFPTLLLFVIAIIAYLPISETPPGLFVFFSGLLSSLTRRTHSAATFFSVNDMDNAASTCGVHSPLLLMH